MENRPIVLARKPIEEKTITENVLKYGTGGINIDGCRIGYSNDKDKEKNTNGLERFNNHRNKRKELGYGFKGGESYEVNTEGRFPANFIIECICDEVISGDKGEVKINNNGSSKTGDNGIYGEYKKIVRTNFTDKGDIHPNPDCPCRILDEQSGEVKSTKRINGQDYNKKSDNINIGGGNKNCEYDDTGGASRYFYNIKNIDENKINKQINEKGKIMETKNENVKLMLGNNIDRLKELPDNFVDSIVTDPPYGLSFMNKKWDYDVPSVEFWKEVLRVLKPGGHVLSFGGTRTYHRMVVNMEDAGFEIRDQIMWVYGSGFPKSLNIGKEVDKRGGKTIGWFGEWLVKWRKDNNIPQSKIAELFPSKTGGLTGCVSNWELGNNLPTNEQFNLICKTFNLPFNSLEEVEREFIGTKTSGIGKAFTKDGWGSGKDEVEITKGNSEWEGWGTGLKPANEPICLARKPIEEKTITENVLKYGTGGLNIDGCRIKTTDNLSGGVYSNGDFISNPNEITGVRKKLNKEDYTQPNGRFPSNFIVECICDEVIPGDKGEVKKSGGSRDNCDLSHEWGYDKIVRTNFTDKGDIHTNPNCPCRLLDEQSGDSKSTAAPRNNKMEQGNCYGKYQPYVGKGHNDEGGASRFFYVPKVSKKERNMGLDDFEEKVNKFGNQTNGEDLGNKSVNDKFTTQPKKNNHPTVKPINLLTYLCRLITPKGGVILDPYMGSGSTGISALLEGFEFIGMEMDEDYFKIAETRINNYELYKDLIKKK